MNLKDVFSISGKSGLFLLVSGNKMPFIVEQLDATKKRTPVFAKDKIVSLGDISIYTTGDDVPLAEVFEALRMKQNNALVNEKEVCESAVSLHAFMKEVYPKYDKERVNNSDIKKLVKWYNILISAGAEEFRVAAPDEEKNATEE